MVPRSYLLCFALASLEAGYRTQARIATRTRAGPSTARSGGTIPTQTAVVEGLTGRFHLRMQFDQYLARRVGDSLAAGLRVRIQTAQVDSLQALSAAEGKLVMSDLRPMLVSEEVLSLLHGPRAEEAMRRLAYPYEKILPGAPLALYFEVYHLTYGADDRTHYTVEYEVYRRTEHGGLVGLFRGDEEQRTSTEAVYTGRSRKDDVFIMIDLGEGVEEGSEIVVTVRVTDETTEQQVGRFLRFEVLQEVLQPER